MTMGTEADQRVKITSTTRSAQHYWGSQVTLSHLTADELNAVEAMMLGLCWLRVTDDGRIERKDRFDEEPRPENDPMIPPSWYERTDWTGRVKIEYARTPDLPEEAKPTEGCCARITVQHLCGYNKTPYKYEAGKMQSFGFECLRSRRGRDGRFWEVWFLPGFYAAAGGLKDALKGIEGEVEKVDRAIDFLCKHVSFGSLEVGWQRACMVID
jgi:hypothetical protein